MFNETPVQHLILCVVRKRCKPSFNIPHSYNYSTMLLLKLPCIVLNRS